ncbi:DUF421 domain-containing protein [Eupransor demetentiae]|uniref:DUF421 domain-containing protein n=1 Tax=Eupransor demetentiae TaxID=3109584 RepID=UPI0032E36332
MTVYGPIILKLTIGILTLIVQMNIMGKGNLAPTSALDQVQNYVLGAIIGGIVYNDAVSVFEYCMVMIAWTFLVFSLKFLKERTHWGKVFIDGKPKIVIERGKVLPGRVTKAGISASDLMFKLREQGIYSTADVKRAVLEQNGQLTVIKMGDENPRYPIIFDGQANDDVLDAIDKDRDWLEKQVKSAGYEDIRDIFVGEYDDGKFRFTPYKD